MKARSILRGIGPVAGALNVAALAVGCRLLVALHRERARERNREQEEREAGRPLVAVHADYSRPEAVGLVVGNFGEAPARDVSFAFSAPVESPEGDSISGLTLFEEGLPFLEPGGKIELRWGSLPALVAAFAREGPGDGVRVTARYRGPDGKPHETGWTVNPLLFEGAPVRASQRADGGPPEETAGETGAARRTGAVGRGGTPVRRRRG